MHAKLKIELFSWRVESNQIQSNQTRNSLRESGPRLPLVGTPLLILLLSSHAFISTQQANMRTMMIDLGRHTIDAPTSVDCARQVRLRRSLRSLVECVVPCCGFHPSPSLTSSAVSGTFFGYRKGRVSFCLQDHTRSAPLLLLEFALPTAYLAREMEHGLLRIALESDRRFRERSLFDVPVWSMYCNGRKVGFAVRRRMTPADSAVFELMRSVSVGAGVLPVAPKSEEGDLMYLRASFERVVGSSDSESFHMMNPVGSSGQELSIFLLRS